MTNSLIHNKTNEDRTLLNSIDIVHFSHVPQTDALPGCATSRHSKNKDLLTSKKRFSNQDYESLALSHKKRLRNKPTALYRHYDENNVLLYIGISISVLIRTANHRSSRWSQSIKRIEIEYFPSVREAHAAEMRAVKKEKPKYNVQGTKYKAKSWSELKVRLNIWQVTRGTALEPTVQSMDHIDNILAAADDLRNTIGDPPPEYRGAF